MPIRTSYVRVKWRKRGCYWSDGAPVMCTRCGVERKLSDRGRRNQAIVMADRKHRYAYEGSEGGGHHVLPVGFCAEHIPEELEKEAPEWVRTRRSQ